MKINMVSLEDGITATGFRKIAGFVERLNPETQTFYVGTRRIRSLLKSLTRNVGEVASFGADEVDEIAQGLAGADIVAFSSMTGYADLTSRVISRLREIDKKAYVMWGGIHPIIYPEDAILADVDAICTGEGEFAFEEFFANFAQGHDVTGVGNFWFKKNGEIKRNPFLPLMSGTDFERLPFPKYGEGELIYDRGNGFVPVTLSDYLANNGLGYPAIWSIGCPLQCTYCGNTVFIANDPNYKKIRHPSPSYIVGEVQRAREIHPHLSTVLFHDDSFMALHIRELTDFATQWREKVGLPFCIFGVIPTYVQREKVEVLTWAGMNRVRMGIQSGSERILKFYRRPTPIKRIEAAAEVLSEFAQYHINPSYDIIVDNPVETRDDVKATLELIYRLARPFTLNIFSLRVIPNTTLEKQMEEEGFDIEQINDNYLTVRPTWANVVLYMLLIRRPSRETFDRWLEDVRAFGEPQRSRRLTMLVVRTIWLVKQGLRHLKMGEFSVITGYSGYVLWKTGILQLWWKIFRRKLTMTPRSEGQPPAPEANPA